MLALLACSDYDLAKPDSHLSIEEAPGWDAGWDRDPTDGAAQIQVLPEDFGFGTVAADCADGEITWFVRNVGDRALDVYDVAFDAAGPDVVLDVPSLPTTLAPGEWRSGTVTWTPLAEGAPAGTVVVSSTDPDEPEILRPLSGTGCSDLDGDGTCDEDDLDRDGDGLADAVDLFPEHLVVDDVHVDFDGLAVGTRVLDQYTALGVHLRGGGAPGEAGDTNVVERGSTCTTAVLATSPNVLCTYVDDGFNFADGPGLAGHVDTPADAVSVRLYNAGLAFAATVDNERDQATLHTYDATGAAVGTATAIADTSAGQEYVDLVVLGGDAVSFELYTGDFDAVDDLHVFRLEPPSCR